MILLPILVFFFFLLAGAGILAAGVITLASYLVLTRRFRWLALLVVFVSLVIWRAL